MGNITETERIIQDLLNIVDDLQSALVDASERYEYRDIKMAATRVYEQSRKFLYERVNPNE